MLPTSCKKECILTHSRACGGRFPVKQKRLLSGANASNSLFESI